MTIQQVQGEIKDQGVHVHKILGEVKVQGEDIGV